VGRALGGARRPGLTRPARVRVRVVAAGTRLPAWIGAGFAEYARRMPPESPLALTEIAVERRGAKGAALRAVRDEGQRMLAGVAPGSWVVVLDVGGRAFDTAGLANWWAARLRDGRDLVFLIGGPDGLARACLARADERLSLSPLTFPHGLARIVLAEQLYRATSLLKGHPYHRA
jgi:23S rRNA (pseudouridine1915-N3)-methyltransferase